MTTNERDSEMLTEFRALPPARRAFLMGHVRRWETRQMTEAESKEMIRRDLAAEVAMIADFASRASPADASHAGGASDAGLLLLIGEMEAIDREADTVFDASDQAPSDSAEERRLTDQGEALDGGMERAAPHRRDDAGTHVGGDASQGPTSCVHPPEPDPRQQPALR